MSTFASLCHKKKHNDKIDVASSPATEEVRLIVWKDDDGLSTTTFLSIDEATHIIELMNEAIHDVARTIR